jgi:hypothetical protein
MTEPLDPATLGVASALKSLRTRVGLREERLHGTELGLDTLTGLDTVRALTDTGESPQRAIVRAVRAAAGTLEPTLSIVADISLGLELLAEPVPDSDLYAPDLGQRREALLRNWDRLHELRSVPPGRAPSPRALRLEVETDALAALALALTRVTDGEQLPEAPAGPDAQGTSSGEVAVSPAELRVFGAEFTKTLRARRKTIEQTAVALGVPAADVIRWAAGQELPPGPQAHALDEFLHARGTIQNLVTELQSTPDRAGRQVAPVPPPGRSAPTLFQTFQHVARALRDGLIRDSDGRPTGWPRDLRDLRMLSGKASAVATAFGIRTLLLLEDGLAADLVEVAQSLRTMARPGGGYASLGQSAARPDTTASVLSALRRTAVADNFDAHIAQMEKDLSDFEKCRPFILTTMLEAGLLLNSGAKLTEMLVDSLLAARRPYGDHLLWPEKTEPLLIDPDPSVAHTARAVRVLANVQTIRPSVQVRESLDQAVAWLLEQRDLRNAYEVIERPVDGRFEPVHVRHFTAAWMVKALVSAGVPAVHPSVSNAVAQIWNSYAGDTVALWAWDNGDLPIWMTYDAVDALRLANLAVPVRAGWSPPS